MEVSQHIWRPGTEWALIGGVASLEFAPQLVFYFGGRELLEDKNIFQTIQKRYPQADILGCSTGGEICQTYVEDQTIVIVAMSFKSTALQSVKMDIAEPSESFAKGQAIGKKLNRDGLKAIFILSEGMNIHGGELILGIKSSVNENVIISGGLAGDGANFQRTLVGLNEAPKPNVIGALGFYGDKILIKTSSKGGWTAFGPKRTITKSYNSILYELDGKPALSLYKHYLGEEAESLPGSALLFPLAISRDGHETNQVVRTILEIDEGNQALRFAGDIPQGYVAQFMHGNHDRLIEGASDAAAELSAGKDNALAILISCIGRKLLLGQYTESEIDVVSKVLGETIPIIGYYSYGEISTNNETKECELHNQTMTITFIQEE